MTKRKEDILEEKALRLGEYYKLKINDRVIFSVKCEVDGYLVDVFTAHKNRLIDTLALWNYQLGEGGIIMGQYYTVVLQNELDKEFKTMTPDDYDNGLKLMEHSYITNDFIGGVMNYLTDTPCRVWWTGDYSNTKDCNGRVAPRNIYDLATDSPEDLKFKSEIIYAIRGYLINKTKKMYLNITTYIERVLEHRTLKLGHKNDIYSFIVSPLPLLTAIGNGNGGGDYHGLNMDLVGDWSGDVIYYTKEIHPNLDGYTEFKEIFNEEEQ